MPSEPLAYFITFTTYGTWLHGRAPGSVDRAHNDVGTPFLAADADLECATRERLKEVPYYLDGPRRDVVLQTILEVARHRGWSVSAVHVRSNHVHIVVSADAKPEKVMIDFKAYASRRLKEKFGEPERTRWTQHGSTLYVWTAEQVAEKAEYVVNGQGAPMAVYDGRRSSSEPDA